MSYSKHNIEIKTYEKVNIYWNAFHNTGSIDIEYDVFVSAIINVWNSTQLSIL